MLGPFCCQGCPVGALCVGALPHSPNPSSLAKGERNHPLTPLKSPPAPGAALSIPKALWVQGHGETLVEGMVKLIQWERATGRAATLLLGSFSLYSLFPLALPKAASLESMSLEA